MNDPTDATNDINSNNIKQEEELLQHEIRSRCHFSLLMFESKFCATTMDEEGTCAHEHSMSHYKHDNYCNRIGPMIYQYETIANNNENKNMTEIPKSLLRHYRKKE